MRRHSAWATSAVVEAYGSSLALNLWPAGSAELADVAPERRAAALPRGADGPQHDKLNSPQAARTLAALVERYPTEQATYRALYVKLGLNPDPPDGWKDPIAGPLNGVQPKAQHGGQGRTEIAQERR